jgi:hypothetical protein
LFEDFASAQALFRRTAEGVAMTSWTSRALSCALSLPVLALGAAACGDGSTAELASDEASGVSVSVAGDEVTLKRTADSTSGTDGAAGQVSCTDDYAKLAKATTEPAPTQPWYAATLITWPAANKESTATLSHELEGDVDFCIEELQSDGTREQQAAQASAALKSAAQTAAGSASNGSFPAVASVVETITAQGFYVEQASDLGEVTETGTMYVITGQTTKKRLVVAIKNSKGAVKVATQNVKGSAKVRTANP